MAYKAFYSRHKELQVENCDTIEDAKAFLAGGSDAGLIFDLCVLDENENIVWHNDFLTIENIQSQVDKYFYK